MFSSRVKGLIQCVHEETSNRYSHSEAPFYAASHSQAKLQSKASNDPLSTPGAGSHSLQSLLCVCVCVLQAQLSLSVSPSLPIYTERVAVSLSPNLVIPPETFLRTPVPWWVVKLLLTHLPLYSPFIREHPFIRLAKD